MANLYNLYLGFIFIVISLARQINASRLCIRNDPLDIKDEHRQCKVLATILSHKEKGVITRTMCKDHVKNIKGYYSYLRIRNGILEDRPSYTQLCKEQSNPLLAWVPVANVRDSIAQELNKTEKKFYIGKATDKTQDKTELCYFKQIDLLSNDTTKLKCTMMIFEDNFFGIDSDINVLVDILPILYEIRNVTYEPWTNVTQGYKTLLGKGILKNPNNKQEFAYGSIDYGYLENIKLNTSALTNGSLEKLPIAFDHNGQVVELTNGAGRVEIRKKSIFGRLMNPKSVENVDLIGQWSEHHRVFYADLYENFGEGVRYYKQPVPLTKISILKISNIEQVYESPLIVHSVKRNQDLAKFTQGGLGENITSVNSGEDEVKWRHPYPEFLPVFVIGCVIVGLALLIPTFRIISTLRNERKYVVKRRR